MVTKETCETLSPDMGRRSPEHVYDTLNMYQSNQDQSNQDLYEELIPSVVRGLQECHLYFLIRLNPLPAIFAVHVGYVFQAWGDQPGPSQTDE